MDLHCALLCLGQCFQLSSPSLQWLTSFDSRKLCPLFGWPSSYGIDLFRATHFFSLPAAGLFHRSLLRGTQGTRLYTSVQVLGPAGLLAACSGRSKSRNMASHHGIVFRRVTANQAHSKPTSSGKRCFLSSESAVSAVRLGNDPCC